MVHPYLIQSTCSFEFYYALVGARYLPRNIHSLDLLWSPLVCCEYALPMLDVWFDVVYIFVLCAIIFLRWSLYLISLCLCLLILVCVLSTVLVSLVLQFLLLEVLKYNFFKLFLTLQMGRHSCNFPYRRHTHKNSTVSVLLLTSDTNLKCYPYPVHQKQW